MTCNDETDKWVPSTSRRKNRGLGRKQQNPTLVARLQGLQDNLDSAWLHDCTNILAPHINTKELKVLSVRCLGLGSPESSDNARAQLAFLLRICKNFGIKSSSIAVYDPVFTEKDKSLFQELGIRVLSETESDGDPVEAPTLFFMPHCDLLLYENVLCANWSLDHLCHILFICNTFGEYLQNNSARSLESKAPHLLKLAPRLTSTPLPPSPDWPGAFNNTSVQFLPSQETELMLKF
ncbi:hypothetical protein D9757_001274 [Collybiopsis confluens]|uniref:SRR1-like domain-containing protein n=1 Tax=Collybiopsis confluens TaxID=2823264 RepID=A0A8H5I0U8_9AGAR|nr:hypothetical protein D9757_001274 [Collybiopsis confluens]